VKVTNSVEHKLDGIELEQIHLAWGHRELPSLKGDSLALIVGFIYREEIDEYLWTSICQRCGDYQIEVKNDDAKSFVKTHNKICGTSGTKKKGS
jgi:hypothetical protein